MEKQNQLLDYINRTDKLQIANNCFQYSKTEHRKLDLTGLKLNLAQSLQKLEICPTWLAKEQYIMQKLVYKMSATFRKHKSFQLMKRALKFLRRLCNVVQAKECVSDFEQSLLLRSDDSLLCPSREYLDWCLCRLLAASFLLAETAKACVSCARFARLQLSWQHHVSPNLLMLGCVATIWKRAAVQTKTLIQLYSILISCRSALKAAEGLEDDLGPLLPSKLTQLPFMSDVLRLLSVRSTEAEQKEQSEFINRLLKQDDSESFQRLVLYQSVHRLEENVQLELEEDNVLSDAPSPRGWKPFPESDDNEYIEKKPTFESLRWSSLSDVKKCLKALQREAKSAEAGRRRDLVAASCLLKDKLKTLLNLRKTGDKELVEEKTRALEMELRRNFPMIH